MAFAPGTEQNHLYHLRLFLSFAVYYGLPALPATLHVLLLFIEFLTCSFVAHKAVSNALSSLRFHHERLGFSLAPFQHIQYRLALRSLPLTMRTPPVQAPPFPPSLLAPLMLQADRLGRWAQPFRALVLLAFYTFARLGSLVPPGTGVFDESRFPVVGDLRLGGDGATLRIKFSKTRQEAGAGYLVPLARASELPCPVRGAARLLAHADSLGLGRGDPLFAARQASGHRLVSLTQGGARHFLRSCLAGLGLQPDAFSFHSFRRGGCTLAFERGAAEPDLALHGDWRSSAIRSYYPAFAARVRVANTLAQASPSTSQQTLPPLTQ